MVIHKQFLNANLFLIKMFLFAKFDCIVHLGQKCFGWVTFGWVVIKILSHPCYTRNFNWFSWEWTKNTLKENPKLNFSNCQLSIFFPKRFIDWFLGEKDQSMWMALILVNLYSREAVLHKCQNSLKTPKMHFLPVFELTLASLTAIWVEQNQCPLHQSILLTQGLIHEIFMKKYWELVELENEFFFEAAILNFVSRPFWIFFCFISVKNPALLYEVSFFSALWMVFPESWKRSCPNFYAHDCMCDGGDS